jgi:hypothetical protein
MNFFGETHQSLHSRTLITPRTPPLAHPAPRAACFTRMCGTLASERRPPDSVHLRTVAWLNIARRGDGHMRKSPVFAIGAIGIAGFGALYDAGCFGAPDDSASLTGTAGGLALATANSTAALTGAVIVPNMITGETIAVAAPTRTFVTYPST